MKNIVNFLSPHVAPVPTVTVPPETRCAFKGVPLQGSGVLLKSVVKPATADIADTFKYPSDFISPEVAAATRFHPETPDDEHSVYWHKREFTPTFLKRARDGRPANLNFTNGVYKSYRIPMPAHTALTWTAYGEGDVTEVASLLSTVTHVGKKRVYGYGAVVNCEVKAIEPAMPITFENRLLKSMPLPFVAEHPDIFEDAADLEKQVRFCGWTPPYWHGGCMEACWT